MAVPVLPPVREGEEIQQHLQVHPVQNLGKRKFLVSGLVVYHTQPELSVVQPAVHAVGHADEGQGLRALAQLNGRDILRFGEIQLEVQRREIRKPQLVRHVLHHPPHIVPQALEEVDKAARLLLKIVELLMDIDFHILVRERTQLLVRNRTEAAARPDLAGHVFEDIVHEGTHLRRLESRGLVRLCLQSVLAEVGEAAGGKLFHP